MSNEYLVGNNISSCLLCKGRFFLGLLLIPVFFSLVFSYNFHVLWLVYDVVAIFLFLYYFQAGKSHLNRLQYSALFFALSYFFMLVLYSGQWILGLLSIWDTFKSLLYFPLLFLIANINKNFRNVRFTELLSRIVILSFFIQVISVGLQYMDGTFFDDIAGTFGDGSSHAIAYLSLLVVSVSIFYFKNILYVFFIIVLTVLINIASENAGYFILLLLLIGGILLIYKKISFKYIFITTLFLIGIYFLLDLSFYSERSFSDVIVSRALEIFEIPDYFDPSEVHGRGSFLFLASSLGGWFGVGPGAFSNIYLMEGYANFRLIDPQINITEVSHLLAESGFVGLFFTIVVYVIFIFKYFATIKLKIYMSIFYMAAMLYSALLMNESHIFLLMLTLYFVKLMENTNVKKVRLIGKLNEC